MILERNKSNNYIYILKGLGAIFVYFLVSFFRYVPLDILHISYESLTYTARIIYNLSAELFMILVIYLIFEKEISAAIQDLKKNHLTYFKKYFRVYLIGVFVMMLANLIITMQGGSSSENETTIRTEFQMFPVYIYVSSVFLAPILEELVFRLGFRSIFKNNVLFITVSSLIFGGLHLIGMPLDALFPIYLISYCSCGVAFAYMLTKTNNIFVSIGFHFMHNGILMSLQTFLLIFG